MGYPMKVPFSGDYKASFFTPLWGYSQKTPTSYSILPPTPQSFEERKGERREERGEERREC